MDYDLLIGAANADMYGYIMITTLSLLVAGALVFVLSFLRWEREYDLTGACPETFSEAVRFYGVQCDFCAIGLMPEAQIIAEDLVKRAKKAHIIPSLQRREFNELLQRYPLHYILAVHEVMDGYEF